MTAEKLGQRAFDMGLLDGYQLEAAWGELGSRDVEVDDLTRILVRRELITNWQLERLIAGKRDGYFYGDYKVLYHVGAGTFARVYRAAHKETGRVAAVKVLRQRYSDDVTTTEQFLREARTVAPLKHPNIVPIHAVDTFRGRPYMVMDFVEGRNLREFVKIRGQMSLIESLRLSIDIARGLEYALNNGITHRDLKLSNVLVSSTGRAQLVDFGLAGVSDSVDLGEFSKTTTPRSIDYAGLERATGVRRNDARSDLYFAGCMLYHMLAGKPPLVGTKDRMQRLAVSRYKDIKPISTYVSDIPNVVVALINRAVEMRPEKRYETPTAWLRDLTSIYERAKEGRLNDDAQVVVESTQKPTEEIAPEQEGQERTVMLIESRVDLQNVLRDKLKRRGYRVLVISDPTRAFKRFEDAEEDDNVADCVVLGGTELGERALETFNQFADNERTADLPVILFIGKKQRDFIPMAKVNDNRLLLEMPLKVRLLRKALLKLLRRKAKQEQQGA